MNASRALSYQAASSAYQNSGYFFTGLSGFEPEWLARIKRELQARIGQV